MTDSIYVQTPSTLINVEDLVPVKVRNMINMDRLEKTVGKTPNLTMTSVPDTLIDLMKIFGQSRLHNLDKREIVSDVMVYLIQKSSILDTGKVEMIGLVPTLIDTFYNLAKYRTEFQAGCRQFFC